MNARYYDGRVAVSRPGTLAILGDGIVLLSEGREYRWRFSELAVEEYPQHGRPGALRIPAADIGARLVVEDDLLFSGIVSNLPKKRARKPLSVRWPSLAGWTTVALLLAVPALWHAPDLAVILAHSLPKDAERVLGEYAWEATYADEPQCVEPQGVAALGKMSRLLAASAGLTEYDVKVMDDREVNAFALPGGRVAVMRGLLEKAESPEEIAGVIAHEFGHVSARHPTQGVMRALGIQAALAVAFGGSGGHEAAAKLGLLAELKFSRDAERDADAAALKTLIAAKVDPHGLESFFERLRKSNPDLGMLNFLSTHPATAERIAATAATHSERIRPVLQTEEWRALRRICAQTHKP